MLADGERASRHSYGRGKPETLGASQFKIVALDKLHC